MSDVMVTARVDTAGDFDFQFAQILLPVQIRETFGDSLCHGNRARVSEIAIVESGAGDDVADQVEIGLGPLHTVFDDKGFAYTSVFLESVVAKWDRKSMKTVEKLPVHYNIGHIMAAEGDTVSPDGKWVVAMNKMSLDRFNGVGPLYPQNFQLVDNSGETMRMVADAPIGIGEPHYSQMIKADKLKTLKMYPPGTNIYTGRKDPEAVEAGKERIEKKADGTHVYMTAIRSHFTPDQIEVEEGETVHLHITSLEQSEDQTHGFTLNMHGINLSLEPGKHENVTFKADHSGTFPFYCTEFCSALHLEMAGYLLVRPKGSTVGGPGTPAAPTTP